VLRSIDPNDAGSGPNLADRTSRWPAGPVAVIGPVGAAAPAPGVGVGVGVMTPQGSVFETISSSPENVRSTPVGRTERCEPRDACGAGRVSDSSSSHGGSSGSRSAPPGSGGT
jgi:hypothetical protein